MRGNLLAWSTPVCINYIVSRYECMPCVVGKVGQSVQSVTTIFEEVRRVLNSLAELITLVFDISG